MTQIESLFSLLNRHKGMVAKHFADFNDADMLVRPVPKANHAAWQMAHLCNFGMKVAKALNPDAAFTLPPNFATAYTKEAAASDEPAQFPDKTQILSLYDAILDSQIAAVSKMTDADLSAPGAEAFQAFAPTVGMMILMQPLHASIHLGQVQVIRRKLGKPVLF